MNGLSSEPKTVLQDYFKVWSNAIAGVLTQRAGTPFRAALVSSERGPIADFPDSMVWLRLEARQVLSGWQVFGIRASEARRLAELPSPESSTADAVLAPEQGQALIELFRPMAAAAVMALRPVLGGEVEFAFQGEQAPDWPASAHSKVRIEGPDFAPLEIVFCLNESLVQSLHSVMSPSSLPAGMAEGAPPGRLNYEPNLDLLLDVELDASLRFGERTMLLREVLELGPGAVIELDRLVDDPVDLLVGNKVIARGEVVVVDGNYGLRVKEMASRQERIDSIRG
jgi:flagellar motor switch protein FliN/FliY